MCCERKDIKNNHRPRDRDDGPSKIDGTTAADLSYTHKRIHAAMAATSGASAEIKNALPQILQTAVLGESEEMPEGSIPVKGYDFNNGAT